MTRAEAIELIRSGVSERQAATWADFGAGGGTFTEAIAELLGEDGRVIAIDRDRNALRQLRRLATHAGGARIDIAKGDVQRLDAIPELDGQHLDGALFGNVLHYIAQPDIVLARVRELLRPQGRIVVVEYDRRSASRWVPHPLPLRELAAAARKAGLKEPEEIGRRKSRYQGELYCAALYAD